MAKSSNKSSETNITRIKATDAAAPRKPAKKEHVTAPQEALTDDIAGGGKHPLAALGGYFKGAWTELKQVRWPDRKTTWAMTGALLAFTAFFVVVILLLDAGFKYLFELLIGA